MAPRFTGQKWVPRPQALAGSRGGAPGLAYLHRMIFMPLEVFDGIGEPADGQAFAVDEVVDGFVVRVVFQPAAFGFPAFQAFEVVLMAGFHRFQYGNDGFRHCNPPVCS